MNSNEEETLSVATAATIHSLPISQDPNADLHRYGHFFPLIPADK